MEREIYRHGFDEKVWDNAKSEARKVMYGVAKGRSTIAYSDLVARIQSISLDAHDPRLAHFLGQIACEDDDNRLGLTTVVVVHKSGDGQPGPGFFEMAKSQGRQFDEPFAFWIEELNRVHDLWASRATQ